MIRSLWAPRVAMRPDLMLNYRIETTSRIGTIPIAAGLFLMTLVA
jgi:hypothetical protein